MSNSDPARPLDPHRVHAETGIQQFDVFIAGSGPIGATYARLLVDRGFSVCMVDIGDLQDAAHPAAHHKNEIRFRKDIDAFVRVIQGALSTVSIPTSSTNLPTLDPSAFGGRNQGASASIYHGRNPRQDIQKNLAAEAVTRCVGGMATHWTCATPEFHRDVERPRIFEDRERDDKEWELLYEAARGLIGTSDKEFDRSIRHNVVLNALKGVKDYEARGVKALPLACHRIGEKGDGPYVRWHSAENVYGGPEFFKKVPEPGKGVFRLLDNTRCTKLIPKPGGASVVDIGLVEVQDLLAVMDQKDKVDFVINAKAFVIASGAMGTPQILANSGFGGMRDQIDDKNVLIPNLGKYITEQPMAFCQIVLRQELVNDVTSRNHPDWWQERVRDHRKRFPNDPVPIPFLDPEPQVTIPFSPEFPWHTQIHRDAFSYGEAGPLVDPRVVVDLRFFGKQKPDVNNRIIFEDEVDDAYGMPQPTFEYVPDEESARLSSRMMKDMTDVANVLGGYLPGSNPQFMTPGLALHLGGTTRLGRESEKAESVADYNSLVWNTKNLYVAGNGVIPTAFASNPTLTSMALAIRSAASLMEYLSSSEGKKGSSGTRPATSPTKAEELKWLVDKSNKNYPKHKELRELDNVVLTHPVHA
ncbi:unnamed protein product [Peniophora sp. CBMAI 1063]|nr:unnamed protein product [Peniophora sp. CBMAI 1063]